MIDHPISLRALRIAEVCDVSEGMRRLTLTGEELEAFTRDGVACPPFVTMAADDHVKVFVERDGVLVLPTQDVGHLDWPAGHTVTARDYTVRSFDAAAGTLDLEVLVSHEGPGGQWAARAQVGDVVHVAGPPYSLTHAVHEGSALLIGDDAALPAIARFFDEADDKVDLRAIVIVEPAQAAYPLPADRVTRVIRPSSAEVVALGPLLDAAWQQREPDFVWAGLEYQAARDLRRELKARGVGRDRSYVSHYWRADKKDRSLALAQAQDALAELTDIMTPWAVRVAATLGIADAVAEGAHDPTSIAESVGADPSAVRTLLEYLAAKKVFVRRDTGFELTGMSELLLEGDEAGWRDFLRLDRANGHMDSSLDGMLDAVKTGRSGFEQRRGKTFWQALDDEPERGAHFDAHLDGWARDWAPAVVAVPVWKAARRVVDVGGGSGALAAALLEAHAHLDVTVVDLPETAARAVAHLAEAGLADRSSVVGQSFFDPLPASADTYVLAQVLHDWPDDEAVAILRRVVEAMPVDGRVVIAERLPVDGDPDHHAEMSLLMLSLFGSRERTVAEYGALLRDVGLELVDAHPNGVIGVLIAERAAPPTP